jgi:hypothetical protein
MWTSACVDAIATNACGVCMTDFSCVETDLGSATGQVASGTNLGAGDDIVIECAPPGGEEVVFQWTPPVGGTWLFDTLGSDYNVGLAVLFPDCAGSALACDAQFDDFDAQAQLDIPEGITVLIAVEGYGPVTGNYVLNINPPPGIGFCCAAKPTPGCNVASCQTAVCMTEPECCTQVWDESCAELAAAECAACDPAQLGDCCVAHPSLGCADLDCTNIVCSIDGFCCDVQWDGLCAGEAADFCGIC